MVAVIAKITAVVLLAPFAARACGATGCPVSATFTLAKAWASAARVLRASSTTLPLAVRRALGVIRQLLTIVPAVFACVEEAFASPTSAAITEGALPTPSLFLAFRAVHKWECLMLRSLA